MAGTAEDNLNDLINRVGIVRRWLVALAILKVGALCVVFIIAYIVAYSILDHHVHFGVLGRAGALVLLLGAVCVLLYGLVRLLLVHISYSKAANYIEERENLDQRLVAAVEYYENRDDYPYSRTLAEQLVMNVCRITQGLRFDSTIGKWRGYVLGGITVSGLIVLCLFVGWNLAHIRPYFARLVLPLAAIEPVSSTSLSPITGDIVAEPDSIVDFAASIEGRVPQSGKLVVAALETGISEANEPIALEAVEIEPVRNEDEQPRLEASREFSETGRFQYRFEAGHSATSWQSVKICDPPAIESITAEVSLPESPGADRKAEPYAETVEDNSIELIEGSHVRAYVTASCPLREMNLSGPDGRAIAARRENSECFSFEFEADAGGTIGLELVSEDGLGNREPTELEVVLKTDRPPEFKLICPDGDYLATNVSSIPIVFEVTDDFGLESAELVLEFPGGERRNIPSNLADQAKNCTCAIDLELEDYSLSVGDSILFFARARDIDAGLVTRERSASSEIYFIEIRSYRQFLHPKAGGGSGQGAGGAAENLLTILEYTRAAIKKTWSIAQKGVLTSDEISRLDSIGEDIEYCAGELIEIRDDPEIGFGEAQKAVLNDVLGHYERASGHLRNHDASPALASEKDAYRVLRKFVDELNIEWAPPPKSSSPQPKKPDAVKLRESPAFRGYEKERIEAEIKNVQKKIEKLKQDQKALKSDFSNFLEQQAKANSAKKAGMSDAAEKAKPSDSGGGEGSQSESDSAKDGQSQSGGSKSQGQQSSGGQSSSDSASAGEGKSQGQGSSASQQSADGQESADSASQGKGKSQGQGKSSSQQSAEGQKSTNAAAKDTSQGRGERASRESGEGQESSDSSNQGKGKSQGQGKSSSQQSGEGQESADATSQGEGKPQGQSKSSSQQSGEGQESAGQSEAQSQGKGTSDSQAGKNDSSQQGQAGQQSQGDSSTAGSSQQSDSSGQSAQQEASSAKGESRGDAAADEARLRMFQARQRQLQDAAEKLKEQLGQMPQAPALSSSEASQKAQDHLDKAVSRMESLQEKLDESRYEAADGSKAAEAAELMDSAEEQLALAEDTLAQSTATSEADELARQAQKMAEQLAEDADALEKSLSPVEQREMRARLEAAKDLLKRMSPSWVQMQKGGGGAASGLVYTMDSHASAADTARAISRQFWSIALEAKKHKQKAIETESSDVKFREAEIEFFKKAAKYGQGPSKR